MFLVLLTAFDVYKALADAIHDQDNLILRVLDFARLTFCWREIQLIELWTSLDSEFCLSLQMGGKSSKSSSGSHYSSRGSASSSAWNNYGYPPPPSPYPQASPYYTPQQHYTPSPSFNYGSQTPQPQRRLDRKYSRIDDNYKSLDQVSPGSVCLWFGILTLCFVLWFCGNCVWMVLNVE